MTLAQKLTRQRQLRAIYKQQLQQLLDKMHSNMNAIERLNKRLVDTEFCAQVLTETSEFVNSKQGS